MVETAEQATALSQKHRSNNFGLLQAIETACKQGENFIYADKIDNYEDLESRGFKIQATEIGSYEEEFGGLYLISW